MTQATLLQNIEKFRFSKTANTESLMVDLEQSADECFRSTSNDPVEYMRLRGSYSKATIKKVFSILGVKVTRINRKPGNCEWKTIVHFTDVSPQ